MSEALNHRPPSGHLKIVHVRVLTDALNCIVDTQQMCSDGVAAYMKDDRHTDRPQAVLVGPDGTGKAAIAAAGPMNLKAAGYSDVWTIGFLTSPEHPNPDP